MADFEITSPSGKTFIVSAPDGATQEQVLQYAQGQFGAGEPAQKSSALDAPNAFASGFLRGATRLVASPVDAAANVLDLGKAALGTPFLLAGKAPPKLLQLSDRADVPGSGENVLRAMGKNKFTNALVNPQNPDYEGGYAQALGGGVAGAVTPGQAALGAAGTVLGKATYDATYDPDGGNVGANAAATTASMLPLLGPRSISAVTKRIIRGGEDGRAEMNRRMAVLREAGVDRPTLGLASGNGALGGIETILQTVPGSMGIFQRTRDRAAAGMQGAVTDAADLAAISRGKTVAGAAVQRDLQDFHNRNVLPRYLRVNDLAEGAIGTGTPVTVHNSIARARQLSTPHPGAHATTAIDVDPRFATLRDALVNDAGGSPTRMDAAGMVYPAVPQVGIPYNALKGKRTRIGADVASLDNVGKPVHPELVRMYDAFSEDMMNGALMTDLRNGPSNRLYTPSSATGALTRANNIFHYGRNREERFAPIANAPEVEPTFDVLARMPAKSPSLFDAVKKSVTPQTRGSVAATVIDELGTATPGSQAHTGDTFSPATFLTNWSKLTPAGQEALLSGFPNAPQVHARVSNVAEAADMMRGNSRHWANPSGTAANQAGREMLRGIGIGVPAAAAGLASWGVPAGVAATVLGARGLSKLMNNQRAVNWAATRTPQLSAAEIGALSRMMNANPQLEQDKSKKKRDRLKLD